jgi:plastocyanin
MQVQAVPYGPHRTDTTASYCIQMCPRVRFGCSGTFDWFDPFMEKTMSHLKPLMTASLVAMLALSASANGQKATPHHPQTIVVKLVNKAGAIPYAFEPAIAVAHRGDTVRFIEDAGVMHNVHFTKQAPGAKLGAAASGPYLTTKGQTYDVVIDGRFAEGKYEYVCDPHAAIGMKGTLVVESDGAPAGNK